MSLTEAEPPQAASQPIGARPGQARAPLWQFAALGGLMALGQAPLGWTLATVLGLAGLLWCAGGAGTGRRAFAAGWLAGAAYFALTLHWIVEPFLVDIKTHGWLAPFGLIGLAGGLALFWGGAFWLGQRLRRGALGYALALAVAEMLRALALTGFPWADMAQAMIDTPLAWILPVAGPRGVGLLLLMGLALIVTLVPGRWALGVVGALGAALWLLPGPGPMPAPGPDAPVVRIVQPNAPQDQKWDPAHIMTFFDRQVAFTAADPRPDLVVWPEMALPWDRDSALDAFEVITEVAGDTPVVLGLPRFEGRDYFNTLQVLLPGATLGASYDKTHLVPFGEYFPLPRLTEALGLRGLAATIGAFGAGEGPRVIPLPGVGLARPLICYEGIFAEEVRRPEERPRLLLLITNDAWFGTFAGPYQHLVQARMRALELGLPMIRAANTGISAMIDARGHITAQLPLGVADYIDMPLPEAKSLTIYAIWGENLAFLGVIVAALGVLWRRPQKSH